MSTSAHKPLEGLKKSRRIKPHESKRAQEALNVHDADGEHELTSLVYESLPENEIHGERPGCRVGNNPDGDLRSITIEHAVRFLNEIPDGQERWRKVAHTHRAIGHVWSIVGDNEVSFSGWHAADPATAPLGLSTPEAPRHG
jgi:hypothetical protein